MRSLLYLVCFGFILLAGCKKNEVAPVTAADRTEVLVANKWRMERITTADGAVIPINQLGVSALALGYIDIQFTDTNIARGH